MEISVIVPIYNVELYLRRCLDTLVAQTFADLELILVDDGSTDGCPAICDEYAAAHANIRVIHKENGGLSDARNAGIEVARGRYLGFVDPDDWVEPDFYAYLHQGIAAYDADVAVCEYYNVWDKSADAANRPDVRLFQGTAALRALLLLKIGNYAWNKLYKRELFGADVRYPKGRKYEDVQTTYRLFQRASRVVALPEPKYYYQRRSDSITGQKTVANQGQCVWSRMVRFDAVSDSLAEWPDVREFLLKEIYNYALEFRTAVIAAPAEEVAAQHELLASVSGFLAQHQEDFCALNGWGRLGRAAFARLCEPTQSSWRRSVKAERLIAMKHSLSSRLSSQTGSNGSEADRLYGTCASLPVDEGLAFVESRGGEDLAGNMLCVARGLLERGMKVAVCAKESHIGKVRGIMDAAGLDGATVVLKQSAEYDKAFSQAKYLFNDMVYPEPMVKRPGQVFVNTWHGTPLKMLEYDVTGQRNILGGATRGFLQCDYLVVPSEYLTEKLLGPASVRQLYRGEVVYSGYPRNAVFFDEARRRATRATLGVDGKEMFVYMPTWRGALNGHVDVTGAYSSQAILDFFERTLADNQVLYVKLHNYAVAQVAYDGYQRVKPFPADLDAYDVLAAADCLITDYSSVFFDFACSGRKVVLFTYDREEYLKDRGLYLDLDSLPFPKAADYDELRVELNAEKRYDDRAFLETYCTYDGADATRRLLDVVIDGNREGVRVEHPSRDAKKNVLVYDARYNVRAFISDEAGDYLAGLDTEAAHYYYGYRQWCLKSTPALLASLPDGILPYAMTNGTYATKAEGHAMKGGALPASFVEHEVNRLFYGNPFDEIYVLDANEYDPFVKLLFSLPNYKGAVSVTPERS